MDDLENIEQAIRDICHSMASQTMTTERQYQISKTLSEVVLPHVIDMHKTMRMEVEDDSEGWQSVYREFLRRFRLENSNGGK